MSLELILFASLAALTLAASAGVVLARNPVTAAVCLVVDLFFLAAIYATLGADFIAAIQIIVYAGAIVVLFLFVIMLLNLRPDSRERITVPLPELLTGVAMVIATLAVIFQISNVPTGDNSAIPVGILQSTATPLGEQTHAIAVHLFQKFIWPFELSSILILLATVGAVLIARKQKKEPTLGQEH
jgi:NADH-quinone oxidoreductase subunit J